MEAGRSALVARISNPAAPLEIGALETPDNAYDVSVVDGLAYIANDSAGLRVIDVSNPAAPLEIGALDTPGRATDIEVVGHGTSRTHLIGDIGFSLNRESHVQIGGVAYAS